MANPQLEEGYIRIANELYRAIYSSDLNSSEFRVLLFIIYQTYGYNRKSRQLTKSYISTGTGVPVETVKRTLKSLIEKKIIIARSSCHNLPKSFSVNKKYDQWRGVTNDQSRMTGQSATRRGVISDTTEGSPMTPNTIQNNTIQNKTRQSSGQPPTLDEILAYCRERGHTFDAEKFFYTYEATGWKSKGSKISNWKALADVWQKTERSEPGRDPDLDEFGNRIKRHVRQG